MEYQLYINGEWKNTVTGYISQDKNPADDSIFAQVHFAGREEVDEAIASAQKAWKPWADTTADEKERILLKAADWMQEHIDEVAGVLMGESGSAFGSYQANTHRIKRQRLFPFRCKQALRCQFFLNCLKL